MGLIKSLAISAVTWPLVFAAQFVCYVAALILVPIALLCKAYAVRRTMYELDRLCWTWPFMEPFQNYEDGISGPPYYEESKPFWLRTFMWTCLRNPANGLRWMAPFSIKVDASKIRYRGNLGPAHPSSYEIKKPSFVYVWQGAHSCFWWHVQIGQNLYRIAAGSAKLYAADNVTVNFGYRAHGTGPFAQFKRVQPGNNRN
jgi:hypothetical protein